MADPLSLVASSFAVVGLADVVLRASAEVYQFLSEIKDAPTEVERLRRSLRETTLLVHASKQYLERSREHFSAGSTSTIESTEALNLFNSTVRALNRELGTLVVLARKHNKSGKAWGTIKWVLGQRKIGSATQKLENSKSSLNSALALVGRFVDHCDLFAISLTSLARELAAHEHEGIADTVKQTSEKITLAMKTQNQELTSLIGVQQKILVQQDKSLANSVRERRQSRRVRKDLLNSTRILQAEHNSTRKHIMKGDSEIVNILCSKLEELPECIAKEFSPAKKSNRHIGFIGESSEMMLSPLLLLRKYMRDVLLHIVSRHAERVSPEHVYWLQSEFENIVSSATQEVAALSPNSTATSFDNWTYSQGVSKNSNKFVQSDTSFSKLDRKHDFEENPRRKILKRTPIQDRLRPTFESFSFDLPVGRICVRIPTPCASSSSFRSFEEVGFTFTPYVSRHMNSIAATFCKFAENLSEPRLYAQLNVFSFADDEAAYIDLFFKGTPEEVDAAFRSGLISPYAVDKESYALCPSVSSP